MYTEPNDQDVTAGPDWLLRQAEALLEGCRDRVANAANLAALLYLSLPNVNWAGFYFLKEGRLLVGPFQGKPACVEIPLGRGVCGTAAASRKIQRVAHVDEFEGHIVCDAASRSEIVIPLVKDGELLGVLDIDSPLPERFGPEDERLLARICEVYIRSIEG